MGAVLYEPQRCALVGRFRQVIVRLDCGVTCRKASKVTSEKSCLISRVQVLELPLARPARSVVARGDPRDVAKRSVMRRDILLLFQVSARVEEDLASFCLPAARRVMGSRGASDHSFRNPGIGRTSSVSSRTNVAALCHRIPLVTASLHRDED